MTFQFEIGARVVVEVTGTVEVRQESRKGRKYIIQPDNPHAAAVHASPEYVFAEDDSNEPMEAEVILFPRGPRLPDSLAALVDEVA